MWLFGFDGCIRVGHMVIRKRHFFFLLLDSLTEMWTFWSIHIRHFKWKQWERKRSRKMGGKGKTRSLQSIFIRVDFNCYFSVQNSVYYTCLLHVSAQCLELTRSLYHKVSEVSSLHSNMYCIRMTWLKKWFNFQWSLLYIGNIVILWQDMQSVMFLPQDISFPHQLIYDHYYW